MTEGVRSVWTARALHDAVSVPFNDPGRGCILDERVRERRGPAGEWIISRRERSPTTLRHLPTHLMT